MLKIDKIQGKKWLEYDKIQNKIIQITLNLKRKRAFLLLFAHLIVPLDKVLTLENKKENGFSFCILLT